MLAGSICKNIFSQIVLCFGSTGVSPCFNPILSASQTTPDCISKKGFSSFIPLSFGKMTNAGFFICEGSSNMLSISGNLPVALWISANRLKSLVTSPHSSKIRG